MSSLPAAVDLPWLILGVGLALLAFGRRLYLLLLGLIGFLVGAGLILRLDLPVPLWVGLAVAAGIGVLGALLAHLAQRLAVGIGGFLLGSYLIFAVVGHYDLQIAGWAWLLALLGAVAVALLLGTLFDFALVVLSSLVGAGLVVHASGLAGVPAVALFAILLTLGVALQARGLQKAEPASQGT